MAYSEDKIDELINLLHRASETGGGTSPFRRKKPDQSSGMTERGIYQLRQGFKALHGDAHALSEGFQGLTKVLALGALVGVIGDVVSGLSKMTTTYRKLVDVGQDFGGSMLNMMQQAGDAGLSVDEFARTMQRNSTVAAVMASHVGDSTSSFINLQKAVRENLKDQGFYGMSLSDLTDTTGDYMETLRQSGQLDKMSGDARKIAVSDLIQETSMLADMTGKARSEILKQTNDALRSTTSAFAQHFMDPKATGSLRKVTAAFASLGDAGPKFAQGINEVIGKGGAAFSELGKSLIHVGFGDLAGNLDQLATKIKAGTASEGDVFDFVSRFKARVEASGQSLQNLAKTDQMAEFVESLDNSTQGLDKWRDDLLKPQDALTQAALTFSSRMETITGNFRSQFYKGVADAFITPLSDSAQLQEDDIKKQLKRTDLDTQTRLNYVKQLNDIEQQRTVSFKKTLDNVQDQLDTMFGQLGALAAKIIPPLIKTFTALIATVNGLSKAVDYATGGFLGGGWSTLIAAGGVFAGFFLILKRFFSIAKNLRGALSKQVGGWASGVFGGRLGRLFGGAAGAAGAAAGLGGLEKMRGSSCLEPLYVYVCNSGFGGSGGGGGFGGGGGGGGGGPKTTEAPKGVKGLLGRARQSIKSLAHGWGGALLKGAGFLFINGALDWLTDELQSSGTIGGTTGDILTGLVNPALSAGLTKVGADLGKKALSSLSGRLMSGLGSGVEGAVAGGGEAAATGLATDLGVVGATEAVAGASIGGEVAAGAGALLLGATAPVWLVPALIAAGVGIAGVGAYELLKDKHNKFNSRDPTVREARYNAAHPPPTPLTPQQYNSKWADANEIMAKKTEPTPPPPTPNPDLDLPSKLLAISGDDPHAPASRFNTRTAAGREAQAKYNAEHLAALKAIKDNTDATKNNTGYGAAVTKQMANEQAKKNPSWWQVALQTIN